MHIKLDSLPSWVKGLSYVEVFMGVNYLSMSILLFHFWLLWYCVDVLISGGSVSLQNIFFIMVMFQWLQDI